MKWMIIAVGLLCSFIALAWQVTIRNTLNFDTAVLKAIHDSGYTWLPTAAKYVTVLGDPIFIALLGFAVVLLLAWLGRRQQALYVGLIIGGSGLIGSLLKLIFTRQRPALWDLAVFEPTYSFPSGHAIASLALVMALICIAKTKPARQAIAIGGTIYVIVVGFTRLVLGVHYPTDVLAGWLVAVLWTLLVLAILRRFPKI